MPQIFKVPGSRSSHIPSKEGVFLRVANDRGRPVVIEQRDNVLSIREAEDLEEIKAAVMQAVFDANRESLEMLAAYDRGEIEDPRLDPVAPATR